MEPFKSLSLDDNNVNFLSIICLVFSIKYFSALNSHLRLDLILLMFRNTNSKKKKQSNHTEISNFFLIYSEIFSVLYSVDDDNDDNNSNVKDKLYRSPYTNCFEWRMDQMKCKWISANRMHFQTFWYLPLRRKRFPILDLCKHFPWFLILQKLFCFAVVKFNFTITHKSYILFS